MSRKWRKGSVGDSDAPRYFTEREFVKSVLAHQIQRGAKQRSAKIAMVVRLSDGHLMIMANNVDSSNKMWTALTSPTGRPFTEGS